MYAPINAITGKPYQGKNAEALSEAAINLNSKDPRWATFLQIKSLGSDIYLKKGSKGTKIVVVKEVRQENNSVELFYKHYTVFNAVQIVNMPTVTDTPTASDSSETSETPRATATASDDVEEAEEVEEIEDAQAS